LGIGKIPVAQRRVQSTASAPNGFRHVALESVVLKGSLIVQNLIPKFVLVERLVVDATDVVVV
jgi:hypothetical protein